MAIWDSDKYPATSRGNETINEHISNAEITGYFDDLMCKDCKFEDGQLKIVKTLNKSINIDVSHIVSMEREIEKVNIKTEDNCYTICIFITDPSDANSTPEKEAMCFINKYLAL